MLHCRISPSDDVYNCTQDFAQSKTIDFKSSMRISLPIFPTSFFTYNFCFSSQLLANYKVLWKALGLTIFCFLFFGTKLIATQNFPFRLSISFLPMLLQLHQSQLDFLISFSVDRSLDCHQDTDCSKLSRGIQLQRRHCFLSFRQVVLILYHA